MGIDIAKLKSFAPSKEGITNAVSMLKRFLKKLPPVVTGMLVLGGIYYLISLYIAWATPTTIAKLEDKLSRESVLVEIAKTPEEKDKHGFQNKQKAISEKDKFKLTKGLYKKTGVGKLPIIRKSDNLTSFRAYQAPFSFKDIGQKPLISFIIQDFGLSQKSSEKALDTLPPEVSFALSPYSALPQEWIKMAKGNGHEVWLTLPIQNEHSMDLGPNTIFHHAALPQKIDRLHDSFALALGYTGVASFTDNTMSRANDHYIKIAEEIYARGLGFLELNPNAPITIQGKALAIGAPYIKTNLTVVRPKGKNSYEELEKFAKKNGYAVAIIPNYPDSIKNLSKWILKVGKMDYAIAPVSAIYDLPLHRAAPDIGKKMQPSQLSAKDHEQPQEKPPKEAKADSYNNHH